jgi:hypothetical protein
MEVTDLNWRKASYSNGGANACIEVANTGVVLVRDTTDRSGPVLPFTTTAWEKFTAKVKLSLGTPQPSM